MLLHETLQKFQVSAWIAGFLLSSHVLLTKIIPFSSILVFGRFLGGVSTSLLFSSFEAWMVSEHRSSGYPEEWLSSTFAQVTAGNSIIAILAGVISVGASHTFGPVAPFDCSVVFLALASMIVSSTWKENTGDGHTTLYDSLAGAAGYVKDDRKILLLGATQALFEGGMYVFVFIWTPALNSGMHAKETIPEGISGWIFASFMVCVAIGSRMFQHFLKERFPVEMSLLYTVGVAAIALAVPIIVTDHLLRFIGFLLFEICVGIFWPSIGLMRSRLIPEEFRSTLMTLFRVPLNLIVLVVLTNVEHLPEALIHSIAALCIAGAAGINKIHLHMPFVLSDCPYETKL